MHVKGLFKWFYYRPILFVGRMLEEKFGQSNVSKVDHYHSTRCSNGSNMLHPTMLDDVEPACWINLIDHHHPTRCSDGSNMLHPTMVDDVGPTCWISLIAP